jgi:hypothetical protein
MTAPDWRDDANVRGLVMAQVGRVVEAERISPACFMAALDGLAELLRDAPKMAAQPHSGDR